MNDDENNNLIVRALSTNYWHQCGGIKIQGVLPAALYGDNIYAGSTVCTTKRLCGEEDSCGVNALMIKSRVDIEHEFKCLEEKMRTRVVLRTT
jgi:hypothetical protein